MSDETFPYRAVQITKSTKSTFGSIPQHPYWSASVQTSGGTYEVSGNSIAEVQRRIDDHLGPLVPEAEASGDQWMVVGRDIEPVGIGAVHEVVEFWTGSMWSGSRKDAMKFGSQADVDDYIRQTFSPA